MRCSSLWLAFVLAFVSTSAAAPSGGPVLLRPESLTVPVDATALRRQYDALTAMGAERVEYSKQGPVRVVVNTGAVLDMPRTDTNNDELAAEILRKLKDVLLAEGDESLETTSVTVMQNRRIVQLRQSIRGIPVVYGSLSVSLEEPMGVISGVGASFLMDRNLPHAPKLSAEEAVQKVGEALVATRRAKAGSVKLQEPPTLAYYGVLPDSERGQLVWSVPVSYMDLQEQARYEGVWIDAIDGIVAARDRGMHAGSDMYYEPNKNCVPAPEQNAGPYQGCAGLPSAATLRAEDGRCRKEHRLRWGPIPGATTYYAEKTLVGYGWAFSEAIADGPYIACATQVDAPSLFRVRACNGCGCSDWSKPMLLEHQPDC